MTKMCGQTPIQIYRQTLLPLLSDNGFELVSEEVDNSRLITRHRFIRQTPLGPNYWQQNECPVVDVVGIPMGQHFLIIHAIVCHSVDVSVKTKIKTNESVDTINRRLRDDFVVKIIELLSVSINDLPLELKFKILSLLPIESLFKMSLVSSLWRTITIDDQLWRVLVQQHFPDFYDKGLNGFNWQLIYKEAFRNKKLSERRKSWATRGLPSSLIFPALPPSPPLLPIMAPPFMPMLPAPPAIFRDLVPELLPNLHARPHPLSRPFMFGNNPDVGF